MADEKTYFIEEVVGTSKTSIQDAIERGLADAYKKFKHIRWFEVVETRGHVKIGKPLYYQVTLKLGYSDSE